MKYDIAPIGSTYRGIERSVTTYNFTSKKAKKYFNLLIDEYDKFISSLLMPDCFEAFTKLIECYHTFIQHDVPCEIIAFDSSPLSKAYGYDVIFLGIDITIDLAESMIEYDINNLRESLNSNGLFDNIEQAEKMISMQDQSDYKLEPCWVYKVIC